MLNWHKRTFCPSVRTHLHIHIYLYICIYSSAKAIWGLSCTCFKVFEILGELWETRPQCPNFSKVVNFYYLTYGVLIFLSRMGSINSFGQAVREVLQNNYLKSNFENSEIRDFVPTFWNFIRGKSSLKKSCLFRTLNANILRTAYDKKINEPILKSFH